ncbi:MAG TPA: Gfo/Idh/MocA family oxidoreductase [Aggregatilineales bacterium]|nr:Gfo/Idh/MocA family oxidoreductase [Anaerolineales bacterium]HRE49579.1 Gfo/Idh/MocA family oxidoreductase [Aggregatilineales bacterium]
MSQTRPPSAAAPLKVIQVGIGNMGDVWLQTVRQSANVVFSGFVEVNSAIAEQQAARYDLDRSTIFDSLDKALANVEAEAIIDVAPPQFRKPIALTAFAKGLPVLAEKPLGESYADALAIAEQSAATGLLHLTAQNYRYNAQVQTMKQILDSGVLGAIGFITVDYYKGPRFGGFRAEMRYPLIVDMAIHHFDMMRYLIGKEPQSVYGRSWRPAWGWNRGEDSAALSFAFAGGVIVSYTGSWASEVKTTPWNGNWRIECERGVLSLEDDTVFIAMRPTGEGQEGQPASERKEIPLLVLPYSGQGYLLQEFYGAIRHGSAAITTCHDNVRSLAMVFQTIASFETGLPVTFS